MSQLPEYSDGQPNFCGSETLVENALRAAAARPVFLPESRANFAGINCAFAIALQTHQPLIPAGGSNLTTAEIISNLKHMTVAALIASSVSVAKARPACRVDTRKRKTCSKASLTYRRQMV